jgi:hypothetical protein
MRHTFSTNIEISTDVVERIGTTIPCYRIWTIELEFLQHMCREYAKEYGDQARRIKVNGVSQDEGQSIEAGARGMAAHHKLWHLATSLDSRD